MAGKTEKKFQKATLNQQETPPNPHFLVSSNMEEHVLSSISTKLNFHSFKIYYIWGFFKFKTLSAQSLLIFSEVIVQISCPPVGLPTCTLSCDELWCLVLNHQSNNEGQPLF